jgi:hypothetical protein
VFREDNDYSHIPPEMESLLLGSRILRHKNNPGVRCNLPSLPDEIEPRKITHARRRSRKHRSGGILVLKKTLERRDVTSKCTDGRLSQCTKKGKLDEGHPKDHGSTNKVKLP